MQFIKMHGIGNDYVYFDCFNKTISNPAPLARFVSDRHFGIGGDGMVMICRGTDAAVQMRMFNNDGTEAEMCGNAVRCVAKYAYENKLTTLSEPQNSACIEMLIKICGDDAEIFEMTIQTGNGVLPICLAIVDHQVDQVCVDMGEAILNPSDIPVNLNGDDVIGAPIDILGQQYAMTSVSVGNPHTVIFVDDVQAVDLDVVGPLLESHVLFPEKINVHFAERISNDELIMRTWERGTGVTLACGTGATAVCIAGVLRGETGCDLLAHLPGGDLHLRWDRKTNHAYMSGGATEVFRGEITISEDWL
jgi:diaminopimelate epimerase